MVGYNKFTIIFFLNRTANKMASPVASHSSAPGKFMDERISKNITKKVF
jgi:hypothetical protein